jgi:hypothetical protein
MQNFDSFFVWTSHERSRIIAVEAMSIDGQQMTTISHGITKKSQMTVIDVSAAKTLLKMFANENFQDNKTQSLYQLKSQPVKAYDLINFHVQRSSGSLNTQHITNFYNVIRGCVDIVNNFQTQNRLKSSAFKIQ